MNEDRKRILEMVAQGKITPDEAAKLLEAVEASAELPERTAVGTSRFIRIAVDSADSGKVNVNIPVGLVKMVMKLLPKDAQAELKQNNIELDDIIRLVQEGASGKLVEVDSEDAKVQIFVD